MKTKQKSVFIKVDTVVVRVFRAVSFIAAVAMILIMFLCVADIILAKLFRTGTSGGMDLTSYLLIPAVYCTLAYVQMDSGLLNVDLFEMHFPPYLKKTVKILSSALGLLISLFLGWTGLKKFFTLFIMKEKSSSAAGAFLTWPFCGIYIIGIGLLGIAFMWTIVRVLADIPNTACETSAKEEER